MKPFDSTQAGMDWIIAHAQGPTEVFIFDSSCVICGCERTSADAPASHLDVGEFCFW